MKATPPHWLYNNQTIGLQEVETQTLYGVPQGGLNSPILFNFALYFCLRELREQTKVISKSHLNRTPKIQEYMILSEKNTFAFADDIAIHLYGPTSSRALQYYTRSLIPVIQKISSHWGLRLNLKKCGLMPLFNTKNRWNYMCFNELFCGIPIVSSYKYLGIVLNSNLTVNDHVKFITKKIAHISKSFYCLKNRSESIRFSHNTWQLFVRPLLDYTFILAAYCSDPNSRIEKLYRNSIRWLLGLKPNSSVPLVNSLIQYNYNLMPAIAVSAHGRKWIAYLNYNDEEENDDLYLKVRFPYNKIEMKAVPNKMVASYNILSTNNRCKVCSTMEKKIRLSLKHVESQHSLNVSVLIEETLERGRIINIKLASIKKKYNMQDESERTLYKMYKEKLINNECEYSIKIWNFEYEKILSLI